VVHEVIIIGGRGELWYHLLTLSLLLAQALPSHEQSSGHIRRIYSNAEGEDAT
jgi:hypothetical protein